jgi:DNA-binding IscR family transcriptional regulator
MRGGWEKVNSAIREALDSVSLAEMLMPFADFERFDNADERSRP